MRGVGNVQLNLALGLAVDALAEELGLHPIEVALRNFSHEWEPVPNKSLQAGAARAQSYGLGAHVVPGARARSRRGRVFLFHHAGMRPGRRPPEAACRSASR